MKAKMLCGFVCECGTNMWRQQEKFGCPNKECKNYSIEYEFPTVDMVPTNRQSYPKRPCLCMSGPEFEDWYVTQIRRPHYCPYCGKEIKYV